MLTRVLNSKTRRTGHCTDRRVPILEPNFPSSRSVLRNCLLRRRRKLIRARKAFNAKFAAVVGEDGPEAEAAAAAALKAEIDGTRIPQVDVSRLPFFRYSAVKVRMAGRSPNPTAE